MARINHLIKGLIRGQLMTNVGTALLKFKKIVGNLVPLKGTPRSTMHDELY